MRWPIPLIAGLLALATLPALAETQRFQVRLYGAPVGEMVLAENASGQAYAAKGLFRTTGLVGLLARVRFEMSARGAGALPNVTTQRYTEDVDTGYRASTVTLSFDGGDRRIDPLTAILAALQDRDAATGCAFDRRTWDGVRSMRITIGDGAAKDDGLVCSGSLTRISGYTPEEMANAVSFPFSVEFERQGTRLVAVRGDIRTIHGRVALVRR